MLLPEGLRARLRADYHAQLADRAAKETEELSKEAILREIADLYKGELDGISR